MKAELAAYFQALAEVKSFYSAPSVLGQKRQAVSDLVVAQENLEKALKESPDDDAHTQAVKLILKDLHFSNKLHKSEVLKQILQVLNPELHAIEVASYKAFE